MNLSVKVVNEYSLSLEQCGSINRMLNGVLLLNKSKKKMFLVSSVKTPQIRSQKDAVLVEFQCHQILFHDTKALYLVRRTFKTVN